MRQLIAVTPDSADRKPVDTGSYTRWNHAYGSVHRGTDAQNRFQSRGNHGQPHQSHDEIQWETTESSFSLAQK
ncbi:hypothetical protein TNCV_2091381 [Trichonephila clavipes]|nr:hypothetical protein TNCV_2091381 [Trichonephila clavipes]